MMGVNVSCVNVLPGQCQDGVSAEVVVRVALVYPHRVAGPSHITGATKPGLNG